MFKIRCVSLSHRKSEGLRGTIFQKPLNMTTIYSPAAKKAMITGTN